MRRFGFLSSMLAVVWVALLAGAAAAPLSAASRAGFAGVGPIIFGTTPAQVRATGCRFTATAPAAGSSCYYLRPAAVSGISFMVEHGTLHRADITSAVIATTDGVRVGGSASALDKIYGSRLVRMPDKYDPLTQTLTVAPPGGANAKYRMVFRTKGGVVRFIVLGVRPAVEYVEGCS